MAIDSAYGQHGLLLPAAERALRLRNLRRHGAAFKLQEFFRNQLDMRPAKLQLQVLRKEQSVQKKRKAFQKQIANAGYTNRAAVIRKPIDKPKGRDFEPYFKLKVFFMVDTKKDVDAPNLTKESYGWILNSFMACSKHPCHYNDHVTYEKEFMELLPFYAQIRENHVKYLEDAKDIHQMITGKAVQTRHDDSVKEGFAVWIALRVALGPELVFTQHGKNCMDDYRGRDKATCPIENVAIPILCFLATYYDDDRIINVAFRDKNNCQMCDRNLYTWKNSLENKAYRYGIWSPAYLRRKKDIGRYHEDKKICKGVPFCFITMLDKHLPSILMKATLSQKYYVLDSCKEKLSNEIPKMIWFKEYDDESD